MRRGRRLAAVDAQFYWSSAKLPSDEFLLYAFAGVPDDLDAAVATVLQRAELIPDLTMRLQDRGRLVYPRWVPSAEPVAPVRHRLTDQTWTGCLDAIARLGEQQLDITVAAWRLHLFTPVHGIPGSAGAGTVAVLQIGHALADGGRAAALAAWLFGRDAPVAPVPAAERAFLPRRAVAAGRAHRQLVRDFAAGRLAAPPAPRPLLATNNRPAGARTVRTLVRARAQLAGATVTVAVLAAVAEAIPAYLGQRCESLGAEVPVAKSGVRRAHNHFGNIGVGLYPELDRPARLQRIAADLAAGRARAGHPAAVAADRAFAAVPAAVLRWGVSQFDPSVRPEQATGNTVVSSVYRGAADLRFGGAPVLLTAGLPALSPVMGLTHGVHGIGDTVTISVHAAQSAIADIDRYLRLLDSAL